MSLNIEAMAEEAAEETLREMAAEGALNAAPQLPINIYGNREPSEADVECIKHRLKHAHVQMNATQAELDQYGAKAETIYFSNRPLKGLPQLAIEHFGSCRRGAEDDESDAMGAAARDQIRALIARIERLEEDKAGVAADIKEVYAEAKSMGYDTNVLRKVISIRKQDAHERQEQEALLELYLGAVGEH